MSADRPPHAANADEVVALLVAGSRGIGDFTGVLLGSGEPPVRAARAAPRRDVRPTDAAA